MKALVLPKGTNIRLTDHFWSGEFDCNCNVCSITIIDPDHVDKLEELRKRLGVPIFINSAYRCEFHNKRIGGSERSRHMVGDATDIVVKDLTPV
jgi:uncharacterized protein YcbK (DUF882 family)